MDDRARKAAFAEAKAESIEPLARTADIEVIPRAHRDDGHLTEWSRSIPPRPKPVPPPTIAEVEALVDGKVSAALANYHEAKSMRPVTREELRALVAEIRSEISAEAGSLRADVEKAKAHAGDRGEIVDLPALPLRSRRA